MWRDELLPIHPRRVIICPSETKEGDDASTYRYHRRRGLRHGDREDRGALSTRRGRVIVIGADGMDAALTERWLRAGELPHLARLSELGGWSPLRTTNPAESPVAWASFATGLNPGKHGLFDFLQRDPQTYLPRIAPLTIRQRADGKGLEAINHRAGETIWSLASAAGRRCTLLRVPGTCPPEPINGRMLSGLGVPDLLGTWGSSYLFTTTQEGGPQVIHLAARGDTLETAIPGPQDMRIPLLLRVESSALRIQCQGQGYALRVGEWSPWLALRFQRETSEVLGDLGGLLSAIARFRLRSIQPDLALYLSPLNIDPRAPCLPITYPETYANELVERHGLFSTLGWPEDAAGVNEGRLDEEGFLQQVDEAFAQQEAMTLDALTGGDDLLISVFEATDRVQHLFWRYQDASAGQARFGGEILRCYRRFDSLVGKILAMLAPEDTLLILSDHGFKPVHSWLHVNAWLRDHGYLTTRTPAAKGATTRAEIEWRKTKAYAIGLSKVYINLRGREREGIVQPGREYDALCQRIAHELLALRDPETGAAVVRQVYSARQLYSGPEIGEGGDLVVGLAEGYRTSPQTAVGGAPAQVITPNRSKWSADHCSVDPPLVPGVLFCNRPLDFRDPSILDLAPTILRMLAVPAPPELDGRSLIP